VSDGCRGAFNPGRLSIENPSLYSLIPEDCGQLELECATLTVQCSFASPITGEARTTTPSGSRCDSLGNWTFSSAKGTFLRHFFQAIWSKWKFVILPVLIKWGIPGAGAVALMDSSTIPVPMDALIAVWVWRDQSHFWAYCLMAALGSAVGGLLPYALGRAGGELFILKRVNRERYERMKVRFEKQEFLAMAIPSALPPPTPWKLFVFAAGVFEMRVVPFMLAVFTGRLVRWLILSALVIKLGPEAVGVVQHHALTVLLIVGGIAFIGFAIWWRRKRRTGEIPEHPLRG
jgi:membrane protein YqaA with SNARE-associated domain